MAGPTASEVIAVLAPQIDRIRSEVQAVHANIQDVHKELQCFSEESRKDRREIVVSVAQHDIRIAVLERARNGNGTSKGAAAATTAAPSAEEGKQREGRFTIREVLALGAGLTVLSGGAGVAISKLVELAFK